MMDITESMVMMVLMEWMEPLGTRDLSDRREILDLTVSMGSME